MIIPLVMLLTSLLNCLLNSCNIEVLMCHLVRYMPYFLLPFARNILNWALCKISKLSPYLTCLHNSMPYIQFRIITALYILFSACLDFPFNLFTYFMWSFQKFWYLEGHFASNSKRCSWRFEDAAIWFSWIARIKVSSANVPVEIQLEIGRYDVYIRYNGGSKTLPCGTADLIG